MKARFKVIPKNENGYIIFCGVDMYNINIFEIIEPINPVTSFYYECSKKFNTDKFTDLFEEKNKINVIFINGEHCIIYNYIKKWNKKKVITANLMNRHNKGGQSSVRFERLAEESRHHYITHCIDYINILCDNNNMHCNTYIYGGDELKSMLMGNKTLKIKLKTDNIYHTFNSTTIYNKYFLELISVNDTSEIDNICKNILEYVERKPDILLFNEKEIIDNSMNVEYILLVKNYEGIKQVNQNLNIIYYILPPSSKYYSQLLYYNFIGKLYNINLRA